VQALVVQHVACEGPGLLQDVLVGKGWGLDIRCMDQPGANLPESVGNHDAFVILGGPMGAYEEESYPYLLRVQELIREAVALRLPALGICLGGQLIARALGAKVEPNPVKEIGWYKVRLTSAGRLVPLFTGMPPELLVFQWHGDTFALHKGAFLLATGDSCFNQAFVYGAHAYGGYAWALQFHPEISPEMIEEWVKFNADELADFGGPGAADRILQETRLRWEKIRPFQELLLNNVEEVLRGTRPTN